MSKFAENETGNSNKDEMLANRSVLVRLYKLVNLASLWKQVKASQFVETG